MSIQYADALVFANRIELIQSRQVIETIPITHASTESWHRLIEQVVKPAVTARGWHFNDWHSPRQASDVLASAFLWKDN